MADVFGSKHLAALVDQAKYRHQIARSHVPQPSFRVKDFLNRLIKPEHRDVLTQTEEVIGQLQQHTYVTFQIENPKGQPRDVTLHFKQINKLLPQYVKHTVLDPNDPYNVPVYEWYTRRMEWHDKFAEVISVLRYMNQHAGTIAGAKLYFHGLTALMEKVEGLEKRTEGTREVRVPSRMPAIPPHMRQAGIRATQTLSLASLYTDVIDQPQTHLHIQDDIY